MTQQQEMPRSAGGNVPNWWGIFISNKLLNSVVQEVSKFARHCAKAGGFFKCCVSVWNLNCFEIARNKLVKEGLIKDKRTKTCKPGANPDPCVVCKAEGVCTRRDIGTGEVQYIYQQKYKREHKVEEIRNIFTG